MRQATSSWRRLGFIAVLVTAIALLSQQAGATPPPPPPISAGSHPWIVALCKFTDLSTEPSTYTPSYFSDLFAGTGSSSVDLADWWNEISYGNINVAGTKVTTQWYSLGMTRYQWAALSRYDKIKACGDVAAGDANIGNDYSKFYGIVAIFNDDSTPRTAQTTLSHGGTQLNAGDTTFNVANGSSFPAAPFGITMDDGSLPNGGNAEEMLVTSKGSGNDWTVTRGYEGSTAQAHNDGATIKLIDGGDLGAADVGTHGITLNGKNYNLGLVVLPPQTNTGAASHETGHAYGYDHSRALSTPTSDYQDCYDMMSFDVCRNFTTQLYTFQGDFGAAGVLNDPTPGASGPGLNAVELDVQGWMPGGRTDTFSPGSCSTTTRDLAALNYAGSSGWMEVRVPTNLTIPQPTPPGGTTTGDYYTVELRDRSKWDRAIPQNAVLIHVHATNKYSYWVDKFGGSFVGHQGALYLADEFVDAGTPVRLAVNKMDSSAHTATVSIAAGGAGCKIAADLNYSGDTSADFNDQATLAADLTVQGTSVPIPFQSVDLSLGSQSCSATTDAAGHAQCAILSINQDPGSYTASASFAGDSAYASASDSSGFTINKEESQVSYTGDTTSHYHDSFTASATLTDPDGGAPISGKSITFTLNGVDTCNDATDTSGEASCSINPTQASGTYSLKAEFAGDTDYLSSSDTASFTVTQEETTTTYTGPTVILANSGAATLSARLQEEVPSDPDADGPLVPPNPSGQTLKLSLGSQSCISTPADSSGNVHCDINPVTVPLGPETVKAEFFGDDYYQPSSDSASVTVFAFPSRGAFVLGDSTVLASPSTVTWWADAWSSLNSVSGGAAPTSFKGFAGSVSTLPTKSPANVCGTTFKTLPGNSPPPTNDVPSYMGVLVASSVSKSGNDVNGTWGKIVVVHVNPGYSPSPGHPGTGTIVATFCP